MSGLVDIDTLAATIREQLQRIAVEARRDVPRGRELADAVTDAAVALDALEAALAAVGVSETPAPPEAETKETTNG